jgi:hypothetical protein
LVLAPPVVLVWSSRGGVNDDGGMTVDILGSTERLSNRDNEAVGMMVDTFGSTNRSSKGMKAGVVNPFDHDNDRSDNNRLFNDVAGDENRPGKRLYDVVGDANRLLEVLNKRQQPMVTGEDFSLDDDISDANLYRDDCMTDILDRKIPAIDHGFNKDSTELTLFGGGMTSNDRTVDIVKHGPDVLFGGRKQYSEKTIFSFTTSDTTINHMASQGLAYDGNRFPVTRARLTEVSDGMKLVGDKTHEDVFGSGKLDPRRG